MFFPLRRIHPIVFWPTLQRMNFSWLMLPSCPLSHWATIRNQIKTRQSSWVRVILWEWSHRWWMISAYRQRGLRKVEKRRSWTRAIAAGDFNWTRVRLLNLTSLFNSWHKFRKVVSLSGLVDSEMWVKAWITEVLIGSFKRNLFQRSKTGWRSKFAHRAFILKWWCNNLSILYCHCYNHQMPSLTISLNQEQHSVLILKLSLL